MQVCGTKMRGDAARVGMTLASVALSWFSCGGPQPAAQPAPRGHETSSAAASDVAVEYVEPGETLPGRVHVVRPNETLYSLALMYYGDAGRWRQIWAANRRRLKNPKDIPVGMKLIIP